MADEIKYLYLRFVRCLNEGADLSSFSKEDLMDVYDYAKEAYDDYIAYEAIAYGCREYPRSCGLAKRKVMFFHDAGMDNAVEKAAEMLPDGSEIKRLLRMVKHCKEKGGVDYMSDLRPILCDIKECSMDDVDVQFMFDILVDNDALDVVVQAADDISIRSEYPTTIYHELYRHFFEHGDMQKAHDYCLKTTDIEPFNALYWVELAHMYVNVFVDCENGAEAADYALALEPDNEDALLLKASALYGIGKTEEAVAIVDGILRSKPQNANALYFKAFALNDGHHTSEMERALIDYSRLASPEADYFNFVLDSMDVNEYGKDYLEVFDQQLLEYLRRIDYAEIGPWMKRLNAGDCSKALMYIFNVYGKYGFHRSISEVFDELIDCLFRHEKYAEVVLHYEVYRLPEMNHIRSNPLTLLRYFISRLNLGMTKNLLKLVKEAKELFQLHNDADYYTETILWYRIAGQSFDALMRYLNGEDVEETEYNPFLR